MNLIRSALSTALLALLVLAQSVHASDDPVVPKPFVVAPECTPEQTSAAVAVARVSEPVVACFYLAKWSFTGAALAVIPTGYLDKIVEPEQFRQIRKALFRDQSVRLRNERDLREAMPDMPPSHAAIPMSLFIRKRTPLGVFLDETNHIGFADLVPIVSQNTPGFDNDRYPLIQLETLVMAKGKIFKLIQISPISGPSTIGEGFRMADDWARRFNGSERLASED